VALGAAHSKSRPGGSTGYGASTRNESNKSSWTTEVISGKCCLEVRPCRGRRRPRRRSGWWSCRRTRWSPAGPGREGSRRQNVGNNCRPLVLEWGNESWRQRRRVGGECARLMGRMKRGGGAGVWRLRRCAGPGKMAVGCFFRLGAAAGPGQPGHSGAHANSINAPCTRPRGAVRRVVHHIANMRR
jgi:hypothetical protein